MGITKLTFSTDNIASRAASSIVKIVFRTRTEQQAQGLRKLWLFRETFYATERVATETDCEEIVLRIKALHYKSSEEMNRLREQVANFEAIQRQAKEPVRRQLRDDVKLLVWSRDRGACVKCGATADLHFDHIISVALGGSDEAENIQLLCGTCNVSKGSRLV